MNQDWEQFQKAKSYLEDDSFYTPAWIEIAPLVSRSEDFKRVMLIIKESSQSNRSENWLWLFCGVIVASILTVVAVLVQKDMHLSSVLLSFSALLCISMPGTLLWTLMLSKSVELDTCFKVLQHNPTQEVYKSARALVKSLKNELIGKIILEGIVSLIIWGTPLFFAGLYYLVLGKDKRIDEIWGNGLVIFLTICIPFTLVHAILRGYWAGVYKAIPEKTTFREIEDGILFMVAISPKWEIIELLG
ncbi:MAG: hypothetical protein HY862_08515 [Chloroflexi bacterium]|nr:hypothetical protein [Chloroflexota bacterium]